MLLRLCLPNVLSENRMHQRLYSWHATCNCHGSPPDEGTQRRFTDAAGLRRVLSPDGTSLLAWFPRLAWSASRLNGTLVTAMRSLLALTLVLTLEILTVYRVRFGSAGPPGFGREAVRLQVSGLQR